jgi:two-component system cell cycle sensor histidine kinase/response regulator CckA
MGITATDGGAGQALADLASALTVVATRLDAVADTAVQAAVRLVGDCAAIQLVSEDGVHATVTAHHPNEERFAVLTQLLPVGASDRDYRVALGGDVPLLVTNPDLERFEQLAPAQLWDQYQQIGATALLVCPLVADETYYGYLAIARTGSGGTYSAAEVDLAKDVAARTALAVATAATVQRLRASEERYRHIVETTLSGVWQLDEQAVTTFVNERMANLLGLPREELIGLPMRGFLDDAGQSRLAARLDRGREGHSEVYDCRLVRAGGPPLWVQISAAPLTGQGGRPAGSLCVVTDITERVAARDARRQLEQLRRQDAIGQLAGGIAHDFNNLLTVIAGSAEILTGELTPGTPGHQFASQIVTAATRGGELSHQLLTFGRRSPHAHPVVVDALLDGVGQILTRAFGDQVALNISTDPDIWLIYADRGQLEQALVNLATNARDAMGRGGVITIEATNVDVKPGDLEDRALSGRFVCLSVADTGAGMDADTRLHAFDAFYTTKTTRGAAGLGLATVRSIITASGGHISLTSEPRLGTTVKLYLPTVDQLTAEQPAPTVDKRRASGQILVVEDQPELAHLTRYLLQPAGYTVTVTTDAADAIAALAAGLQPDLLLTDVVMPGMTGPELAAKLRDSNPELRVLYMSGYTAGVLAPQGHLDNDATLLQKPFNRESLLTAVAKALSR